MDQLRGRGEPRGKGQLARGHCHTWGQDVEVRFWFDGAIATRIVGY
jgi:hypothetical protein